jgi:hypothetical protein
VGVSLLAMGTPQPIWPMILAALALLAIGAWPILDRWRQRSTVECWVGVALLAWGWAEAVALVARRPFPVALFAAAGLRAVGMAFLLGGGIYEFAEQFAQQRSRLLEIQISEGVTRAQQRAMETTESERRHDAGNVLMAVQAAGLALQRKLDVLSDADRATLAEILRSGLGELNKMVGSRAREDDEFLVESLDAPLRRWASGISTHLTTAVPEGLCVKGSRAQLLDSLRTLVELVARQTGATPVRFDAQARGSEVLLQVGPASARGVPLPGRPSASLSLNGADDLPIEALVVAEIVKRQAGTFEIAPLERGFAYRVWLRSVRPVIGD